MRRNTLVGIALAVIVGVAVSVVLFSDLFQPDGAATGTAPSGSLAAGVQEVQFTVSAGCTGTPASGTFCSLDDAVDKASLQPKASIVLKAGEYKLTRTIRKGITIRAEEAQATPAFADVVACALPAKLAGLPSVTLRTGAASDGSPSGFVVDLADEKERLVLSGVHLLPSVGGGGPGKRVLTVKRGQVSLVSSVLAGSFVATGTSATVTLVNSRISIPATASAMQAGIAVLGSEDRYNEVPVTHGLCEKSGEVGVAVLDGARLYSIGLDVSGEMRVGVCVSGGEAHLCGGSLHDTNWDCTEVETGWGAYVGDGGELELKAVDVADNNDVGILAEGEGTSLLIKDGTEVTRTAGGYVTLMAGMGVVVQDNAELVLQDSSVVDVKGPGVVLSWGASATVTDSLFQDDEYSAFVVLGATLNLSGSSILGTGLNCNMLGGWGVHVSNDPYGASTVAINDTRIDGQGVTNSGILVMGTGPEPSTVSVSASTIQGMAGEPFGSHTKMGAGFYAFEACQGITLSGNTYKGNVGPQIFLHGSDAAISGETIATNGNLDVLQQDCTCATASLDEASLQAGQKVPLVLRLCDEDAYWEPFEDDHFTIFLEIAPIEG